MIQHIQLSPFFVASTMLSPGNGAPDSVDSVSRDKIVGQINTAFGDHI